MRIRWLAASMIAASTTGLLAAQAHADSGFGRAGEIAISADQPLAAGSLSVISGGTSAAVPLPTTTTALGIQQVSASDNGGSATAFSIAPEADYFVADNLSVGLQVLFGVVSHTPAQGSGTSATIYGAAPQLGYRVRLADKISLWPKVYFSFEGTSFQGASLDSGTLGAFAPVLFHLAPHFYAGIGPDFSSTLFVSTSNTAGLNPPKTTTYGAMATFGGWFGS